MADDKKLTTQTISKLDDKFPYSNFGGEKDFKDDNVGRSEVTDLRRDIRENNDTGIDKKD